MDSKGDKFREFFKGGYIDDSFYLDSSAVPVEDVLVKGKSVVKNHIAYIEGNNSLSCLYKCGEYLYEANYNDLDYAYAKEYYDKFKPALFGNLPMKPFGCSSLRVENFYGRNFDFYYNHDCSFVVRTPKKNGRNATIGVGSYFNKLTKDFVESGKYDDAYKLLPFMIVDGINEHGLFVNINVVTVEGEKTTGTMPTGEKKGDICMMMLPRFILDNYKTAKEAILDIEEHYSIYLYEVSAISGSELHFMIGDENETYMMEFVNNKVVYEKLGTNHPEIMTNFYTLSTELIDGRIDETPENKSKVALLGCGLERYNILIDNKDSVDSKESMFEVMKNIWYTKAYNPSNKWYTELVGLPDRVEVGKYLTVETPRDHYNPTLEIAAKAYENRDRDQGLNGIWHTTHTSVYDIKERKLYLHVQEEELDKKEFVFDFNKQIVF